MKDLTPKFRLRRIADQEIAGMPGTPIKIRALQRERYTKARQEYLEGPAEEVIQTSNVSSLEESACFSMKNIGKPCTGKPYARLDERGQAIVSKAGLLRHSQTKGGGTSEVCPTVA
jgi:hypothetical protein